MPTPEVLRSRKSKPGREYWINYNLVGVSLDGGMGSIQKNLSQQERNEAENVLDYALFLHKDSFRVVNFDNINLPDKQELRYGVIYLFDRQTIDFDFVNNFGGIIIPNGTVVAELLIPKIEFSSDPETKGGKVVSAQMITESLNKIADRLVGSNSEFVYGLTTPRMANIAAKRWGFHLENHPFPKGSEKLFDATLALSRDYPKAREAVQAFRDQVLVYQTQQEFSERFAGKNNS